MDTYTEMSRWRTNETSLGVSFETCFRRSGDVLMGRCYYILLRRHQDFPIRRCGGIPLRHLGVVPPRYCWVYYFRRTCDVAGMYRETSLWWCHDVLLPGGKIISNTFDKKIDEDTLYRDLDKFNSLEPQKERT